MKARYEITYQRIQSNGSKTVQHDVEFAESVSEAKGLFQSKYIDGRGGATYKIISCVKK